MLTSVAVFLPACQAKNLCRHRSASTEGGIPKFAFPFSFRSENFQVQQREKLHKFSSCCCLLSTNRERRKSTQNTRLQLLLSLTLEATSFHGTSHTDTHLTDHNARRLCCLGLHHGHRLGQQQSCCASHLQIHAHSRMRNCFCCVTLKYLALVHISGA